MALNAENEELYPYCLKPVIKDKVWGGRHLEELVGKELPPGKMIGETWEAWEGCLIENGPARGETLAHQIEMDPAGVLGPRLAKEKRFPLLFKFIDAQDDLSVQVHPDDAQAQVMEHYPFGKTEAWYILDAAPNANLILGFKRDVGPEELYSGIRNNSLVDLLSLVPVQRGDVLFVPAGTVHAISKGIVLAEIQENSDITYRLYDWGRQDKSRALHVDQSLGVANLKHMAEPKIPPLSIKHLEYEEWYLVACRYFVLQRLDVRQTTPGLPTNGKFHILSVVQGQVELLYGPSYDKTVTAGLGQTLLIPAGLGGYKIAPTVQPCQLLRAFVPDLNEEVLEPLIKAGYGAPRVARLSGSVAEHNDLLPF